MHEVALLRSEVSSLRKANEALSKRRRAKKIRIRLRGSLAVQDIYNLLDQTAVGRKRVQETQLDSSSIGGGRTRVQCYSIYDKPGYNARTCQEVAEASDLPASDVIIVGS